MRPMKIGVIGLGDISSAYLNNLLKYPEYAELYACACRTPEKAERKKAEFGFKKAYATGDALIKDPEVEVVLNLTTPAAHFSYNMAALLAGKHVYCEKPLAAAYAEGKQLLSAAREKGLYIGCAPDTFMGSRIQTFRRLIDEGVTGEIVGGVVNSLCRGWEWFHPNVDFYYQPGAGPVLDIGPYYITALLSLLGPVDRVTAMGSQPEKIRKIYAPGYEQGTLQVHPDVMTHIMAVLHFRSGAVVNANFGWNTWDSRLPRMELYGTKATLCMADEDPNGGPNVFGGDTLIRTIDNYRWKSMPRDEKETSAEWQTAEVKHDYSSVSFVTNHRGIGLVDMIQSIWQGIPNRAGGPMALHMLEVCEAILTSAREERFVRLESDFEIPAPMPY